MSINGGSLRHVLPSSHRMRMGWTMPTCAALQAPLRPMITWEVKNRWLDIFRSPPCYIYGVSYIGPVKSLSTSNKGSMSLDAMSSKKAHVETEDLDDDDNVLTEEDLKYKPMGFGQGKTYDTSLEDELLKNIEYKKAAEVSKPKVDAASKKPKSKPSATIDGIKVWVGNLPKKKNIDRNLRSAFRHVPGLLDISPSVLGNEKTRDPICKGFGFLTFDTLDHATSFMSSFENQLISFGKVEKRISLSMTKASSAEVVSSGRKSLFEVPKLRLRDKGSGKAADSSTIPELRPPRIVQEGTAPDSSTIPEVEVIEEEIEAASFEEDDRLSEEEDDEFFQEEESDDDYDSDDESEFEVSVEMGDPSAVFVDKPQGAEGEKLSEAERQIRELEERIRKKLAAGDLESRKKSEKPATKPRGFISRKAKASRKGNSLASVTHGLKKKEREVMTGVLEKYGRGSPSTKP